MNRVGRRIFYLLVIFFLNTNVLSKENDKTYINIESDRLVNIQNPPMSEFIGNVYAYDEINHFWGDLMIVNYDENKKIEFITIENNVKIRRDNEEVTGNFARYNTKKKVIEILGNVIVIRNDDILKGEKLTIDLLSSTSIITGSEKKRVSVKIIK